MDPKDVNIGITVPRGCWLLVIDVIDVIVGMAVLQCEIPTSICFGQSSMWNVSRQAVFHASRPKGKMSKEHMTHRPSYVILKIEANQKSWVSLLQTKSG